MPECAEKRRVAARCGAGEQRRKGGRKVQFEERIGDRSGEKTEDANAEVSANDKDHDGRQGLEDPVLVHHRVRVGRGRI